MTHSHPDEDYKPGLKPRTWIPGSPLSAWGEASAAPGSWVGPSSFLPRTLVTAFSAPWIIPDERISRAFA